MAKDKIKDIDLRNITEFLDTDYKDYVFYVLQNRALPSLCDGFKTGARKIMHAAFNGGLKNGSPKKLLNLSGDTLNLSLYAHGDTSLNSTIVTLSQEFKFNLNPLYIDGQNGSLRNPKGVSAPRYLYVKLSDIADIWKTDIELTEPIFDEGQFVEPENFLPIIPTVLTNAQTGMAPGYKFQTLSYNPLDIIKGCAEVLKSRKKENKLKGVSIRPYVREYDNSLWQYEDNRWISYGKFTMNKAKDIVEVTMLPHDMDFDSFEKLLNKLVENGKIKDWKNYSDGSSIKYHVIFNKKELAAFTKRKDSDNKVLNMLKLKSIAPDDLLWVLDENGKIRHFLSPHELIEYFTEWRLTKYTDRKSRLVKILEEKYDKNSQLVKFIELVCKGKLKIRNRSKVDIKKDMDGYKLPLNLISTPMSKCTIEERDELLKENEAIKKELDYIKKTTEKQMYLNDLKDLEKRFEKIYI